MPRKGTGSSTEHPMTLASFRSWIGLLRRARSIGRAYLPRLLFVSLTTLLTGPLRWLELLRYGRALRQTEIHPSPVFIIGHWRSGTTHLHNLLAQDEAFGALTTFQAMAPGFCLVGNGAIKRYLGKLAADRYETRLIDSIPLAFDAPQEDEFAIANLFPHAFIHTFSLPRQAQEIFKQDVLLEGLPVRVRRRWRTVYLSLLRKVSFANGGRRLVIKNCAHSARIPAILEAFPDAKFIHIHRDPYQVFLSTLHMHQTVLPKSQLQEIDPNRIKAHVLRFYDLLMRRLLADRSRIPAGNLIEIRFDDLETAPLMQLHRIYEELDLPGFAETEDRFRAYLNSVSGYRRNEHELTEEIIERVNQHWGFAFEPCGYRLRPLAGSTDSISDDAEAASTS